ISAFCFRHSNVDSASILHFFSQSELGTLTRGHAKREERKQRGAMTICILHSCARHSVSYAGYSRFRQQSGTSFPRVLNILHTFVGKNSPWHALAISWPALPFLGDSLSAPSSRYRKGRVTRIICSSSGKYFSRILSSLRKIVSNVGRLSGKPCQQA